jgi:hypothetical protein
MIPRLRAIMAAWMRSLTPGLERMLRTWPFTVSSLIELGGDLLVRVALGNQAHDTYFGGGQRLVGRMLGELVGNLRRKRLLTSVNGSSSAYAVKSHLYNLTDGLPGVPQRIRPFPTAAFVP